MLYAGAVFGRKIKFFKKKKGDVDTWQPFETGNYLGYLPVSAWISLMPQALILCRPEYRYLTDPEPTLYRLQHALLVQVAHAELMQFDDICVCFVYVSAVTDQ